MIITLPIPRDGKSSWASVNTLAANPELDSLVSSTLKNLLLEQVGEEAKQRAAQQGWERRMQLVMPGRNVRPT